MNNKSLFLIVVFLFFVFGCTHKSGISSTEEIVQSQRDPGQIPVEVLREVSTRYEGSMDLGTEAQSTGGGKTINVILGPVNLENFETPPPPPAVDAGQRIREVIAQKITARQGIGLVDAPKERFINDSPRPDLARRGIKYVVKGVASFNEGSGKTTVFLRLVNTSTGKVVMVASGRSKNQDEAASMAAEHLLNKLGGEK